MTAFHSVGSLAITIDIQRVGETRGSMPPPFMHHDAQQSPWRSGVHDTLSGHMVFVHQPICHRDSDHMPVLSPGSIRPWTYLLVPSILFLPMCPRTLPMICAQPKPSWRMTAQEGTALPQLRPSWTHLPQLTLIYHLLCSTESPTHHCWSHTSHSAQTGSKETLPGLRSYKYW